MRGAHKLGVHGRQFLDDKLLDLHIVCLLLLRKNNVLLCVAGNELDVVLARVEDIACVRRLGYQVNPSYG